VMLVTMAAIDSPRPSARNKRLALILIAVMLVEVTAWAAFSLWGVTLPSAYRSRPECSFNQRSAIG
jgi:hypothetical protein